MSWQAYVDDSLIGSGYMHSATIVGLRDGSVWAYGGTYIPQQKEIAHILKCLENLSLVQSSGITICNVKFFGLQSGVDGQMKYIFFKKGAAGGCIYTSKQAAIISVYGNPADASSLQQDLAKAGTADVAVNPADCNSTVKRIAEYLISLEY
ncbi:profilin [Trypanosoma grayi]|uniref:profilin n=1 Tax=Trypanosoma grayi TaxID=71804 RepID=UPI0004F49B41|nr:profilin [Trypanosoma grayi]KEG14760.1 profilin [Trypanosoma grayi]